MSPITCHATHPEYEAVGDEESLQAGNHRLRLKPARRRRHLSLFVFLLQPEKERKKFTSQRPGGEKRGRKLRGINPGTAREVSSLSQMPIFFLLVWRSHDPPSTASDWPVLVSVVC